MLSLTPEAAARVRHMMPEELTASGTPFLRIWRPGSSLEPGVRMAFVADAPDDDHVGVSQGVPLCVAPDVASQLAELVLDCRPDDATGLFIRAAT